MPTPTPSPILSFVPIILIFVIFYFLLIRPQQKKQKEHAEMVSKLKKGDQVITNGGIYGIISSVKDRTVLLKIDENVKMEIQKNSIAYITKNKSTD